jgi:hypothetical protein
MGEGRCDASPVLVKPPASADGSVLGYVETAGPARRRERLLGGRRTRAVRPLRNSDGVEPFIPSRCRSAYSDSSERLKELRVRVRSTFASRAAAGFMILIQP